MKIEIANRRVRDMRLVQRIVWIILLPLILAFCSILIILLTIPFFVLVLILAWAVLIFPQLDSGK